MTDKLVEKIANYFADISLGTGLAMSYEQLAETIIPIIRKAVAEEIKRELEGWMRSTWQFTQCYEELWKDYWERRGT